MKHISAKAYKGFNQRLIDAFRSIDPYHIDGIGVVMGMIDLYLGEKDVMFHVRSTVVKLAYMMILPELEKAVERSMRARRNAAIRREKKLAKLEAEKKEKQADKMEKQADKEEIQAETVEKHENKEEKQPEISEKPEVTTPVSIPTDSKLNSVGTNGTVVMTDNGLRVPIGITGRILT